MTWQKRVFDIVLALLLGAVVAPVLVVLLIVLAVIEGRPLFYVSERMHSPTRAFRLIKLRTMRSDASDGGVTGGDKTVRIGPVHRILRKTRLDEIPQLWNVLRGDMSFVGPRPPLRVYVMDFPHVYGAVLRSRPGITGLASLVYHRHEERLLGACDTAAETDAVYRRRCIPAKARLDLIYQQKRSFCFDLILIAKTAAKPFQR